MLGLTNRLWNKYFGSLGTISAKDMITKFEEYPFVESEVDDNVSICMFYLRDCFLKCRGHGKERMHILSHPHHISSSPDVAMFDKKLEMIRFEIVEIHRQHTKDISIVEDDEVCISPISPYQPSPPPPSPPPSSPPPPPSSQKPPTEIVASEDNVTLIDLSTINTSTTTPYVRKRKKRMAGKKQPQTRARRCIKKSAILKSPFTQLPNSGPPREKEPLQVMFDPFLPIPPVDRNALMTFLKDSNRVDHDCIYERLDKPSFQNIINSGG
ncbi:hypothetical protein FNV43_RR14765 [Rhamnella rubrinervis]|uniref:Uncharacterized protein n=1 Tax=Rhamnella rubrinervis TaxID=2594499 RepID=A0A8K0MGM3_9ROSA|nr:hypothetical protein FNV43_RR14765 [Rhamnella rubrinervis]